MRAALRTLILLALACASPSLTAAQCISLGAPGSAYTQSFDTLSNVAGSTTNNLTISGWYLTESGGGARDNEQYAVDTGGSNSGDTYSYGASGSTERALGQLRSGTLVSTLGACFTNDTGAELTSLDVAYTGEQWRLGTTGRTDRMNFAYSLDATSLTSGAWTGVAALDFLTPDSSGSTGAKDGNATGFRTALSASISSLAIPNGATFWIRWVDTDASGADDGLAVDDFSLTPQGSGGGGVNLAIDDLTLAEGDSGGTVFTFTVTLSRPAEAGGVTFDIATADGTATVADDDYVAKSLTGQIIVEGDTSSTFAVTVNGDTTPEANETFFVNVTNVVGATVTDGQGTGTISNDDVTLTPIHDIQGPGASSPLVGASVTTRGIVTGVKVNGFFIQEPDATVDADPSTSEGVLVFTASVPPAAAAVGNLVQVTGTVAEYVPSADPLQPPLTELTSPSVSLLSSGHPLPAAVPLAASFPDPAGGVSQLERLEGMRIEVASLTVVGPTLGNVNETAGTVTSTGVFHGVVTGVARPFREPGIPADDPAPGGSIPPIPRFDGNPEIVRVDSDGQVGASAIEVGAGAVLTGLVGPLDYAFRAYTILPDPAAPLTVDGGPAPQAVSDPLPGEVTVASFNLQRFFDDVNDPAISEPVPSTAVFAARLAKASLAIRDFLKAPDIVGVQEVEGLSALQALADRISIDALAAAQPDPQYVAYLTEGNDVGGIDVGFLVKTAEVASATPRVTVNEVVQESAGTLFVNPDSSTELLNDRPPLRLDAEVNQPSGPSFPLTVIVNHLRSLNDVNSTAPGSKGWPTAGDRVRAKRLAQAEDLANLVQTRQTAAPAERIVLVGDFNAFEFNDGLVDSIGVIAGTPSPDDETAVPGDGVDLVNPDLAVLQAVVGQRYSYVFDGNAQSLDHVLVNQALIDATTTRRLEHARIGADFPETARTGLTVARLSDHDPGVAYLSSPSPADLSITKTDGVATAVPGASVTYTIVAANAGPTPALGAIVEDVLPAAITAATWSCTGAGGATCPASGSGSLSASVDLPAGGSVTFTLVASIDPAAAGSLVNTATVMAPAGITDPDGTNDSATDTDSLTPVADLSITKSDGLLAMKPGSATTYSIVVSNGGPSGVLGATVADHLPAVLSGATWACTGAGGGACASGGSGDIDEPVDLPAGGSVTFSLTATLDIAASTAFSNTASVSAPAGVSDPASANDQATDTNEIAGAGFHTVPPCRLVDTRAAGPAPIGGPALAALETRSFVLAGQCGIPATARAVAVNIAVTEATSQGHLRVFETGTPLPTASTINYLPALTRANNGVFSLSPTGAVSVYAAQASGTVHLILDVQGYFE